MSEAPLRSNPATSEACEVCHFEWDALTASDCVVRLREAAAGYASVLTEPHANLHVRPEPTTWSPMEYCGHVRDCLFNLRDRIVLGLAEDNPTPKAMFQSVRIDSGLYAADTPATISVEIAVAADLLAKTVAALDDEQLARPIFYPYPRAATRTLLWVAAQALHEAEHHLDDVRAIAR
jgi:hypothetical protein